MSSRVAPAPVQLCPIRDGGTLHRSAVVAVDRLAVPTVGAASSIAESGSNLANSTMKYTVSAGNRWGSTTGAVVQNSTPTVNQALRFSIAQATRAEWYDIFLSTDAAPLWVGRITEAQRAAGGFIISTVGTVTANATTPAGSIDIGIVGTGVAWNVAPFDINTAWDVSAVTAVDCTGRAKAKVLVKLAVTDLRSLPTCKVAVFIGNALSTSDLHLLSVLDLAPLTTISKPLEQEFDVDVDGASGIACLVHTLTGQGSAVSVWIETA